MSVSDALRHRPIYDGICIIVAAAIIGPPIGGFFVGCGQLIVTLVYTIFEFSTTGTISDAGVDAGDWITIALVPFLYALWSYLFGFVPAFGSGLFSAVYAARFRSLPMKVVFFFVFVVSALFAIFVFMGDAWSVSLIGLVMFCVLVAAGWIAAFLVHRLIEPFLSIAPKDEVVQ